MERGDGYHVDICTSCAAYAHESEINIIDTVPKTGLFSTVVAAFIIETYKTLQVDTGSATVALLTQLVTQSQTNAPSTSSTVPPTQDFKASTSAIRINILMVLSLFLSLTCALMSTLIQQWARDYLKYSQLSASPPKRARVRAYLFQGLTKFQMRRMVESIPVLLHISVFLFFFAFSEFLHTANSTVGLTARYCVIVLLSAYIILSILPLIVSSSPYQTALTNPLRPCVIVLRFVLFRLPLLVMKGTPPTSFRFHIAAILQHNRSRGLLADTEQRSANLDHLALQWLLEDGGEDIMDKFVTGLPELIHSPFIADATATMEALLTDRILDRVGEHLVTCMSSRELSQLARITRAIPCVEALDAILSVLDQWADNPQYRRATNILVKSSDVFRMSQDPTVALRAACIRALTFHKLILNSLSTLGPTLSLRVPPRLLPLALRLQTWASTDSRRWRSQAELEEVENRVVSDGYDAWSSIVHDGHLVNFLVLIRDALSYAERPSLDFTTVLENLEEMVNTFSITQSTPSTSAWSRFKEIHADIREYIYGPSKLGSRKGSTNVFMMPDSHGIDSPDILSTGILSSAPISQMPNESPHDLRPKVQDRLPVRAAGRYSQLLEFMDKIDRGLRIVAMLRAGLPKPANPAEQSSSDGELPLSQDQIFTKYPFDSFDVFDIFSSALPTFISSASPENARDTVEKLIAEDDFLRSINQHLQTSISSEVPVGTREYMCMACLDVLDEIFKLLEGSSTVRWYEVGTDAVLFSLSKVANNFSMVGCASAIRASCALGLGSHIVMSQFRARAVQGHLPIVQNREEQVFILTLYDGLCQGDEPRRMRRRTRRQGDPDTVKEASSPQYLENLLLNGPLNNFSIMAFHLVPHLKANDLIPEITWTILRKLMEVPGLADVTESVELEYFKKTRDAAHKTVAEVVEKEGRGFQGQLDLLEMLDTVADWFGLPKVDPIIPSQPDSEAPIPSNGSGHAPVDI